jgi:cytochrome c
VTRTIASPLRILLAGMASAAFVLSTVEIHAAAAGGDAKMGQTLFNENCAVCHSFARGEPNKIGPNLFGVVGKASGSAPGYMYSPALMNAKLTWDNKNLNEYLAGPQKKVPGTKMGFPGFSDPSEQQDVIAYLATLK